MQACGTLDRYDIVSSLFIKHGDRFFARVRYCVHHRICSTLHRQLAMTSVATTNAGGKCQREMEESR
jgi:hypothetical protein